MNRAAQVRRIPFVKATACGNDFLLIDSAQFPGEHAQFTRQICDRNFGVGADGVEWMLPSDDRCPDADVRIHLINADGSPAEISGNGTRCVAAHWLSGEQNRTRAGQDRVTIQTDAGLKICRLTRHEGSEFEFETAMGQATVGEREILPLAQATAEGVRVSTGNPHFVMFVDAFAPQWQRLAAEIGAHASFINGTNVEFVKIVNSAHIEIRIFERGAGETQSSGTGSFASAVATVASGRARSPLQVSAPGGSQTVRWDNGELFLRGPANLICRGEYLWQS